MNFKSCTFEFCDYTALTLAAAMMWAGCSEPEQPQPQPIVKPEPQKPDDKEDEDEVGPPVITEDITTATIPHYIIYFFQPEKFSAKVYNAAITIFPIGKYAQTYSFYDEYFGKTERKQHARIYNKLCEKNNDMDYSFDRWWMGPKIERYSNGFSYLADNLVSIDIISYIDYDEEHPAGTSLSDLCILEGSSPKKHIDSGYKEYHIWSDDGKIHVNDGSPFIGNIPISKPLNACTPEDLILLGDGYGTVCTLKFTKRPTTGLPQIFLITLVDECGKVFTIETDKVAW